MEEVNKKRNHNYKGGSIASNGYKIIFVGKTHHLADVRGYAYEHRINAEKKIGRRLLPKEQVHHKDENKLNNNEENLEVVLNMKYHRFHHRKGTSNLQNPDEDNIVIKCHCGCGEKFLKYDDTGRPRKYISGHNTEKTKSLLFDSEENIIVKCLCGCGAEFTKYNKEGRLTKYKYGHSTKTKVGLRVLDKDDIIKCACGCCVEFKKYDKQGRPRKYISGHNRSSKHKI